MQVGMLYKITEKSFNKLLKLVKMLKFLLTI